MLMHEKKLKGFQTAKRWAAICLPHHVSVEQLVSKNRKTIDRLPDYLKMIRDHDMIPGLSCHMPELVIYSDLNGYDVEKTFRYILHGLPDAGEIEYIHKVIWEAEKPVITIKPMAAGRVAVCRPDFYVAYHSSVDMVAVGCLTPEEADEDIEISLAAWKDVCWKAGAAKTEIMK